MGKYWEKRAKKFGHTGWKDSTIYVYDQEVRLRVIKYIIEQYGKERDTALDYGGGVGDFSILLSEMYQRVIYYDISETVTNIAKEKLKRVNVVFENDNQIFEEKYDMIICITVLQHIKDDKELLKLMKSFREALNENGKIIILEDAFARV